ncbi:MAG: hypothetical protein H8E13_22070 [Actinobacteria bacterium]|nr:hypothetical protein [Actinomycetota bacterium]
MSRDNSVKFYYYMYYLSLMFTVTLPSRIKFKINILYQKLFVIGIEAGSFQVIDFIINSAVGIISNNIFGKRYEPLIFVNV